jgi:NADH dehydrogenase
MAAGENDLPHVVIIGGGFGGLACARALGGARVRVTLIDRRNHNLFQPLLYQVATAAVPPADIAEPIRKLVARHLNIRVLLGEVVAVDTSRRQVRTRDGAVVAYDKLVMATGSQDHYFGNEDWSAHAPGLKSISDAQIIRQRLLLAFEKAEQEPDPEAQRQLLTTVIIGGGPTGVEMAGSIVELGRSMISSDFRNIGARAQRVVLVEGGPRLLPAFPEELSDYARRALEAQGVEVMTDNMVESIGDGEVRFGDTHIKAGTIVWGAGVKASPAAEWLGVEADRGGRIAVSDRLKAEELDGVYCIGDIALCAGADGEPLPALAQVASQQGRYLGRALKRLLVDGEQPGPFAYRNRGTTAVIGRKAAVIDFGKRRITGRMAWLLWAAIHVYLLSNPEKRLFVGFRWAWRFFTRQRGARLIDEESVTAQAALVEDSLPPAALESDAEPAPERKRQSG